MKRVITLFLTVILVFSCAACKPNDTETGNNPDKYILQDCKTEYTVVIPQNAGSMVEMGKTEFVKYFKEATGVEIPVKKDDEVTYKASSKIISIGETSIIEDANVATKFDDLKEKGVRVVTKDNSVFLLGRTDYGTYNAVIWFLNKLFDLDFIDGSCYYIDENVIDVPFYEYDVVDNPDIDHNLSGNGSTTYNTELANHLNIDLPGSYFIKGIGTQHNVFQWLPKETYQSEHPEFYSINDLELCYNARGVEGSRELMINAIADKMLELIKNDDVGKCLSFTQNDYGTYCNCEYCNRDKAVYGTNAATTVKFVNDLKIKLDSLCNEEGVRKVPIAFFAYQQTEKAPVKTDENGNLVPIDDSVVCKPGVWAYYAPVYANYTKPLTADGVNGGYYNTLKEWTVLTESVILWFYSLQFNNYFMPYGYYNAIQSWMQGAKMVNANYLFNQGENENAQHTAFRRLTIYLTSKLSWNADADINELISDFFKGAFGPAADKMYRFFQEEMVHMNYNYDVLKMSGSVLGAQPLVTDTYWPKNVLMIWLSYIEDAYKAIEPLKLTNPSKYQTYRRSILQEKVSIDYMLIEAHSSTINKEELLERRLQFKSDVKELGITRIREGTPCFVEDLYSDWGI